VRVWLEFFLFTFYVSAIMAAEAVAIAVDGVAGAICHAGVLLALLMTYSLTAHRAHSHLIYLLALVPLLRILSLTMPTRHVAEIWWYPMVGAPLLLAAFLATRAVHVPWPGLRMRRKDASYQAAIALTGAPLGVAAYAIMTPEPLISPLSVPRLLVGVIVLVVFSALAEEIVFRGLLQGAAREAFGVFGILIVGLLYSSIYAGSLSAAYMGFSGAVGIALAAAVDRTGVLWGAVGARALVIVGLLLVWPVLYE
jgi:uncharacterized protein